ncbi:non-homologous end joining protein Ku [Ancylobacter lacus]|uniref:non-homologous end joining protein Ku n=1 Tax=Ancylobacter lacus TaxID=2579970 RepID=UPI001BCC76EA|nr:Ku protein [Ancylobacter lacus]MBS7540471.1 Ku protein [Ancylobacter lacus]
MAVRANWRGFLKLAELTCPVGLYTAASTSDRVSFHTLNRRTGHRVHRQFVDRDTGAVVEREEQVKGYELAPDSYLALEPEEIAAAVPDSDKTLAVDSFVPCAAIDDVFLDRPYYLAPGPGGAEVFALLREGLRRAGTAALARTVLFRRVRTVLIRPHEDGMIATTLNFDYEVRSSREAFRDIPKRNIGGEMLDLARHIIATKAGTFDPTAYNDRYEEALAELVRAKAEGRRIEPPKPRREEKVVDLLEALRMSAGAPGKAGAGEPKPGRKAAATSAGGTKEAGTADTGKKATAGKKGTGGKKAAKAAGSAGTEAARAPGTKAAVRPRKARAAREAGATPRRKAG